jgi:hypothetical protein
VLGELTPEQIDLSSNALTGDIPGVPDSVIYLNVSGNPLGGSIQGAYWCSAVLVCVLPVMTTAGMCVRTNPATCHMF